MYTCVARNVVGRSLNESKIRVIVKSKSMSGQKLKLRMMNLNFLPWNVHMGRRKSFGQVIDWNRNVREGRQQSVPIYPTLWSKIKRKSKRIKVGCESGKECLWMVDNNQFQSVLLWEAGMYKRIVREMDYNITSYYCCLYKMIPRSPILPGFKEYRTERNLPWISSSREGSCKLFQSLLLDHLGFVSTLKD